MKIYFSNAKAQSVVELAVLSSMMLLGVSLLLSFGQRLEMQQKLKMDAFRLAMKKAYEKNGTVSYTIKKDVRFFNLFGGFGQGQLSTIGASASLMWQKGMPGPQGNDNDASFAYHVVNDQVFELDRKKKEVVGFDGSRREIQAPVSVWKEERSVVEQYDLYAKREENAPASGLRAAVPGVKNRKKTVLTSNIETKIYTRFDKAVDEAPWADKDPWEAGKLPEYEYTAQPKELDFGVYNKQHTDPATGRLVRTTDEYATGKVNNKIVKQKTWETPSE
ncbi:MAG: hypothetical protein HZC15_07155 [Candidatus Omnitrophica bacterium]|nr:hypothetical protein [Candidatus Omnitrophota bacterium]